MSRTACIWCTQSMRTHVCIAYVCLARVCCPQPACGCAFSVWYTPLLCRCCSSQNSTPHISICHLYSRYQLHIIICTELSAAWRGFVCGGTYVMYVLYNIEIGAIFRFEFAYLGVLYQTNNIDYYITYVYMLTYHIPSLLCSYLWPPIILRLFTR